MKRVDTALRAILVAVERTPGTYHMQTPSLVVQAANWDCCWRSRGRCMQVVESLRWTLGRPDAGWR
jgi:hypothetical protein